jgi:hypothetical protein
MESFLVFSKFLRERSLPRRIRGVLRGLEGFSSKVYLKEILAIPGEDHKVEYDDGA